MTPPGATGGAAMLARRGAPPARAMTPSSVPGPEPLAIRTRMTGSTRVVAVGGEIDLATVDALVDALASRSPGETDLVLDLSATTFIDSTGIRVLVEAHRDGERHGIPFTVVPGGEALRGILVTTGVAAHLRLADAAPA